MVGRTPRWLRPCITPVWQSCW